MPDGDVANHQIEKPRTSRAPDLVATTLTSADPTPLLLESARSFMEGERRARELFSTPTEAEITEAEKAALADIRREQGRLVTVMSYIPSAGLADMNLKAQVLDTFVADNLGPYADPLDCSGLTRSLLNDHLATKEKPDPDADLLHLGRLFEAAWTVEKACWARFCDNREAKGEVDEHDKRLEETHEHCYNAVSELIDQIEAAPALTLKGLRIKARAFAWLNEGEVINGELLANRVIGGTDIALAAGIIRGLLAMGEAA